MEKRNLNKEIDEWEQEAKRDAKLKKSLLEKLKNGKKAVLMYEETCYYEKTRGRSTHILWQDKTTGKCEEIWQMFPLLSYCLKTVWWLQARFGVTEGASGANGIEM